MSQAWSNECDDQSVNYDPVSCQCQTAINKISFGQIDQTNDSPVIHSKEWITSLENHIQTSVDLTSVSDTVPQSAQS